MTVKNRTKNNSQTNETTKSPAKPQDEAAKKSAKNASAGTSAFMKFIYALFYLTLAGGAGLAAFYFQQVLSEVKLINLRHEESTTRYAKLNHDVERSLQQMTLLKSSLDSLEEAVVGAKADLKSTSRAVQKEEDKNRQLEETLQNLQNKIFHDLTNGIQEVKDAREKDVSSLERTLEERLAQLSRSITDGVAEFAGEQNLYKNELRELKDRMEERQTPGFDLKQELASVNAAVANLNTANEVAEGNAEVLREQIAAVGAELQTRNKEVASVSQEIDDVRTLVRSTAGALREEVSAVRSGTQAVSDKVQALTDEHERFSEVLQTLETLLREEVSKADKRGEDVEVRLKVTEKGEESLTASLSELKNGLDALTSKSESHENSLNDYRTSSDRDLLTLRDDLKELKNLLQVSIDETRVRLQAVEQKLDGSEDPVEEQTGPE